MGIEPTSARVQGPDPKATALQTAACVGCACERQPAGVALADFDSGQLSGCCGEAPAIRFCLIIDLKTASYHYFKWALA